MSSANNTQGYELRETPGKGEGIFATQNFQPGEIVMVGRIEKMVDKNNSHASQIGLHTYVMHAGLISKVNHSCDPNCGIKVNETGGHDFVAFKEIKIGDEITFDYLQIAKNYGVHSVRTDLQRLDIREPLALMSCYILDSEGVDWL